MLNLDKIKSFDILSKDEQIEALALIDKWKNIKARTKCRDDFLEFVKMMWQGFIMGRHHKILADKFNRIAQGKLKRLIVCLPPRHSKSE
jgi:hypothetical protein